MSRTAIQILLSSDRWAWLRPWNTLHLLPEQSPVWPKLDVFIISSLKPDTVDYLRKRLLLAVCSEHAKYKRMMLWCPLQTPWFPLKFMSCPSYSCPTPPPPSPPIPPPRLRTRIVDLEDFWSYLQSTQKGTQGNVNYFRDVPESPTIGAFNSRFNAALDSKKTARCARAHAVCSGPTEQPSQCTMLWFSATALTTTWLPSEVLAAAADHTSGAHANENPCQGKIWKGLAFREVGFGQRPAKPRCGHCPS